MSSQLFSTVPQDHLSLFKREKPNYPQVVEFLSLRKEEVARATGIAPSSIRYDEKIPKDLAETLLHWAVLFNRVAEHFKGDIRKTALWFNIPNPMLGNISPKDMIRLGRYKKLLNFVIQSIEENNK
jgi:uncharacterized protein (DUF2384 family)